MPNFVKQKKIKLKIEMRSRNSKNHTDQKLRGFEMLIEQNNAFGCKLGETAEGNLKVPEKLAEIIGKSKKKNTNKATYSKPNVEILKLN